MATGAYFLVAGSGMAAVGSWATMNSRSQSLH